MAGRWLSLLFLLPLSLTVSKKMAGAAKPPIFVFGDSLADVGNNNFLSRSSARADYPHNGIDFPGGVPTGRFGNGLIGPDFIAQYFGYKMSPPPFMSLTKANLSTQILKGINFASAGAGLLNDTGAEWVQVNNFWTQTHQQFRSVHQNLTHKMGSTGASDFFCKSLFLISVGSNDLFESWYANHNQTSDVKTKYVTKLVSLYKDYLTLLYNMGARKFGLISVPPLGCCPAVRIKIHGQECVEDLNESAQMFFQAISALMKKLSSQLKGIKYSIGNTYDMIVEIEKSNRFKELKAACCGIGKLRAVLPCMPNAKYCKHRDQYLFWDMFHTTEAAVELAALALYNGTTPFVTPINFKQLFEEEN